MSSDKIKFYIKEYLKKKPMQMLQELIYYQAIRFQMPRVECIFFNGKAK